MRRLPVLTGRGDRSGAGPSSSLRTLLDIDYLPLIHSGCMVMGKPGPHSRPVRPDTGCSPYARVNTQGYASTLYN